MSGPVPREGWLVVAELGRPHGVRGHATARLAGVDGATLVALAELRLRRADGVERSTRVLRVRPKGDGVILELEGLTDRDAAEEWRGAALIVRREQLPEPGEREWWIPDLLGSAVVSEDGEELGILEDVLKLPANDVMVVRGPRGEVLLPVTWEVVRSVDAASRRVLVHVLPGLLEEREGG